MKKKRFQLILAVLLIVSIIITGCSSGSKQINNETQVHEELKDSVTIAINAEPSTLDPMNGNDLLTFKLQYQVFDTLVMEDQDGNLVPSLAESWDISEDGLQYTFNLRKDTKFHNGETLTADDVVFSFERAIASKFTSRITGAMDYIEKVNDNTVRLHMKYPYGPTLGCISTANMGIVSKKAALESGDGFARKPIGTGPYKLVDWISGDKIVFESFGDYYRGEASIKKLTYNIISDSSTALVALERGEVDVVLSPTPADRNNIMNNRNLELSEVEEANFAFIAFNTETGIFANEKLREAVSYAIDRESVILGALEGVGTPLYAPMPPSVFGFPKEFKGNEYNPEKAKELLAEAGYPNGFDVKLRTMESPTYAVPTQIVQDQLRAVGIRAEIELMERGAYLQDVYTDTNYEITVINVSALVLDADLITFGRFHSSLVGGGNNLTRFQDEEMDKVLELGRKSQSNEERIGAYQRVSEIVREKAPIIPLHSGMRMIAYNKNLKGVKANAVQKYYVYDFSW